MKLTTKYYQLEYKDAAVRWIKSGNVEIVRMICPVVRDHNWGTLEAEILKEKIDQFENGFGIEVLVKYQKFDIHFESVVKIIGRENELSFEMNGIANSSFRTCRIGICLLHPIKECSGKPCYVFHTDSASETIIFPGKIDPRQPMKDIKGMKWNPSEEIQAQLDFAGDIFEMEDQRNWTDGSFKTYSRPIELPFPYLLQKEEKVFQKIDLCLYSDTPSSEDENDTVFKIDKNKKFKLPRIGTCISSRNAKLTENEAGILKELSFDHLRHEVTFINENWKTHLQKAVYESKLLDCPLFLVFYFSNNFEQDIKHLKQFFSDKEYNLKDILIVGGDHLPDDNLFQKVFDRLEAIFKNAAIGTGTNAYFAELNRHRPQKSKAEFISFTICPQIHAFDDDSLVENLEAQKYVIESAIAKFPSKPIYVSPVTLKQRFNIVATTEYLSKDTDELPAQVDLRQNSIFAAQWLLGSLKFLSQSGADLVTYFESVGRCGFIHGDFQPPIPEKFKSNLGDIFPIYYLLKEFKGYNEVIYSESKFPLDVEGVVLQNNEMEVKLIMANFSDREKSIDIESAIKWTDSRMLLNNNKLKEIKGQMILPPNAIAISKGLENSS